MIIIAFIFVDSSTPKEVFDFFERLKTFCALGQNELWKNLIPRFQRFVPEDTYRKTPLSIGETN